MKKSFKLLSAVLMACAMFVPAQANETLLVCDGTSTSAYLPIKNNYYDTQGSHSQMIYPAEQLAAMNGQAINSVTFYSSSALNMDGGVLAVSMGETESPVYESSYITGLTQVAAVSMTSGSTELTINFDTPYNYNGGNLVIDFYVQEAGECGFSWCYFYGETQTGYTAIQLEGSKEMFLPKVTFDYGVPEEWAAQVTPAQVTFNTIRAEREDLQTIVLKNTGLNAFTPALGTLEAPFSYNVEMGELAAGESVEIPLLFAPAVEGEYSATLTIDCGEAGIIEVPLAGTAIEAANEVLVCDDTEYNAALPVYGLYFDTEGTMSQMIYPAYMLADLAGQKIMSVTFYPTAAIGFGNGTLQISLKEVEEANFSEAVAITDMTTVANATIAKGETEITITFDEPFQYNGGNLAIETLVTAPGSYSSANFYGVKTEDNAGFHHYVSWGNDYNNLVKFLPKANFVYQSAAQLKRGDVNGDDKVDIDDVTALIDCVLQGTPASPASDCNVEDGDGVVNINDITALIHKVLTGEWEE